MVEEHVHAHYAHGNGGEGGDKYIMPVAVILAAVILSATIFMTASGVNTQLAELNSGVAKLNSVQVAKGTPEPVEQATAKPAAPDAKIILSNPSLYPALGPEDSKTTVIEFIDFQCPFCAIASGLAPWADQYRTQYGDLMDSSKKVKDLAKQGKLRYAMVTMSFLGPESVYAAQAGLCANQQGKFFEMEDEIFKAQTQGENTGKYNKDKLVVIAQPIDGLDQAKFKDCLENDKTLADVQKVANTASLFTTGTPTFYVNGNKVQSSWTAIQSAIGA